MGNATSRFAGLKAMADGSLLRTATLHDTEYLVVPIVSAVGDEVWWPANSPNPELVPAEVLEAACWSRNNRPIVAGHPRVNGEYVSANSPEILEKYSYGHLFAAEFDNKRVKVEAWFNKSRAKEVGPDATNVISRLEKGEQIEVSEGNMVVSELKEGELDGKPYKSVWLSAICDHLATVSKGACDNEMGCGGPRVNEQRLSISSNKESQMKESDKKSFFSRLFGSALTTLKSAMSNNELRMKLFSAAEKIDQGVVYVDDEDVEAGTFRYCVVVRYGDYWDYENMEHHYYQRSFSIGENGEVSIGDDRTEVEWFEGWRNKSGGETETTETELLTSENKSDCSCHERKEPITVNASEKKALVTRLIGAARSPFEESDRGVLEGMKEEKLTSLMSAYEGEETKDETTTEKSGSTTPVTVPTAAPISTTTTTSQAAVTDQGSSISANANQVVISREEYLDIKAAANAHKSRMVEERNSLIASIKSAQSAFTEEALKEMTTTQLEMLAQTLKVDEPAVADYSVRGRVESRVNSGAPTMRELPDTWGLNKSN